MTDYKSHTTQVETKVHLAEISQKYQIQKMDN